MNDVGPLIGLEEVPSFISQELLEHRNVRGHLEHFGMWEYYLRLCFCIALFCANFKGGLF